MRIYSSVARSLSVRSLRSFSTHPNVAPTCPATTASSSEYPDDWSTARPYAEIPGPGRVEFLRWFMPGGALYKADALCIQRYLHSRFGTLARLPVYFGQRDAVYTFDPKHFELIFRTEGAWPMRRNLDTLGYYRDLRPDLFKGTAGLVSEHGLAWQQLRSAVTPVVMSPKLTKAYMPAIDQVSREFVERIGRLRDSNGEMPADFNNELGLWGMESIGVIALDRRFGVMSEQRDEVAVALIQAIRDFLRLAFELEMKPSMWRYFKTRKLNQLVGALDVITKNITNFIDEAIAELEKNPNKVNELTEISLLQSLLKKERHHAFLTTFDMLLAGIDTTSSAMATLMYRLAINPEQQEKLRDEVLRLLPRKDSPINNDNFDDFTYFRACLKESMRLQPQLPVNLRAAGRNIILDGYRIPKNTDMIMANNLLHMSDEHFTNSERFLPERWLRNDGQFGAEFKSRHPFVYLPLGFGARMCIGKRFAEMELQILTARILREYRIEWHHEPMKFVSSIVITTANDLKLRMVPL